MPKLLLAAGIALALLPATAHAYIDPGSGGAIITAVLGFIGAVGYAIRKYYYRIKRLFSRKRKDDSGADK